MIPFWSVVIRSICNNMFWITWIDIFFPMTVFLKEDVAAERKKQTVVEQVMIDQLCR